MIAAAILWSLAGVGLLALLAQRVCVGAHLSRRPRAPKRRPGISILKPLCGDLHLASAIGPGQIGARALAGKDLVVGKSMALTRRALEELGGFAAFANHLAEDYVIGQRLAGRIALATLPVLNIATERTVASFWARYARWGVIHRTAVTLPTSLAQALLNPWPLALAALLLHPTPLAGALCLGALAVKAALDVSSARALGCEVGLFAALAVPVKDLLLFAAWALGLVRRTVDWRGNRLRVGPGSKLVLDEALVPAAEGRS